MLRRLVIGILALCICRLHAQTELPLATVGVTYKAELRFPVKAGAMYPFKLTYKGLPPWLKPDDDRREFLSGKPSLDDITRDHKFTLVVTDDQGWQDSFDFNISVSSDPIYVITVRPPRRTDPIRIQPAQTSGPPSGKQLHTETENPPPANSPQTEAVKSTQPPGNQSSNSSTSGNDKAQQNPSQQTGNKAKQDPAPAKPDPPTFPAPLVAGATQIVGIADKSATVELIRGNDPTLDSQSADASTGTFAFDAGDTPLKAGETLTLRQITKDGTPSNFVHPIVTPYYRNGEELRAVLGYQQAGASAARFDQNWFLDFYISRPLAFLKKENDASPTMFRWWGNVRVASFPQAGDVPVATFATNLVQQFGQLQVNQLVQSAEFLTGFEIKLLSGKFPFLGRSEETRQLFTLGLIGGGGATGPMDPSSSVHIFEVPGTGSPQLPVFQKRFPGVTSQFVGFTSPDRDNFLREYLLGLRLTTRYVHKESLTPMIGPPAMLGISVGQNEVVTGGKLHGAVLRTEAFYPLPFFNRSEDRKGMLGAIYLFGTAQMHIGNKLNQVDPVILKPRPDINAFDPGVTLVTTPNNRDVYHLGIGIDLVHAINTLTHPDTSKSGTQQAPKNSGNNQNAGGGGGIDQTNSAPPK